MKRGQLILWILTPVFLLVTILLVALRVPLPFWCANLLVSATLLLPVTAMLLRTLQNKSKNLNVNYFILKFVFIILLYAMIVYLFILTMLFQQ